MAQPLLTSRSRRRREHGATVARLAAAGLSAREIHHQIGGAVHLNTLYAMLRDLRELGDVPQRPAAERALNLYLPSDAFVRLAAEAKRRNMRPGRLAGLLVRQVLADDIVQAVLDDDQ